MAKTQQGIIKLPLRDGDTEREDEAAGHWFINANSRPQIVDKVKAYP